MYRETADSVQLAIFAKAPIAGYAKTRLIPALGSDGAASLQALLIRRTVGTALASSLRPVSLWCAPDATHDLFVSLRREYAIKTYVQSGDDLGMRMLNTFEALTKSAPTLLIGTDCPVLSTIQLNCCALALRNGSDAVFIPAEDGGYALIGLRKPARRLFENIAFGTSEVMRRTRERVGELGLSAFEADALWDLDTPADYERAKSAGLLSTHPL